MFPVDPLTSYDNDQDEQRARADEEARDKDADLRDEDLQHDADLERAEVGDD